MVYMNYRCESCGRAFAHEADAQVHTMDCHGGTSYETLGDA